MMIHKENIDWFLYSYVTNQLTSSEKQMVEEYIDTHVEYKNDLQGWKNTLLTSNPSIIYAGKDILLDMSSTSDRMAYGALAGEGVMALICILGLYVAMTQDLALKNISNHSIYKERERIEKKFPLIEPSKTTKTNLSIQKTEIIPTDSLMAENLVLFDSTNILLDQRIEVVEEIPKNHARKVARKVLQKQNIDEIQPQKEADLLIQDPINGTEISIDQKSAEYKMPESVSEQKEEEKGLRGLFKRKKKKNDAEVVIQMSDEEF